MAFFKIIKTIANETKYEIPGPLVIFLLNKAPLSPNKISDTGVNIVYIYWINDWNKYRYYII